MARTQLSKDITKVRNHNRMLASFYYKWRSKYPEGHWRSYYNEYKRLGGRLPISKL